MSDVIDDLKVQIDASTQSADAKLDKFIAHMMKLQSTITGLEMSNVSNIASGINQISASIQNFNNRTKTADFSRVATGMNKLATVDAQGVSAAAQAMSTFASNMVGLSNIHVDSDEISNIANAIAKLGRATVTEATQNLEFLKTSMKDFITGMNSTGSLTFDANGLVSLVNNVSRLGSTNATQSVKNLPQISSVLKAFIADMNAIGGVTFDFTGLNSLVGNISKLGGAKATQAAMNLKPIRDQILRFVSGLNGIGALNFDTTGLANLVSSITKLGGKSATTAIPNIQALGVALSQLMATLSHAPAVSQNLIQMTTALASLAGNGSRVSSASTAMYRGLNLYSGSASRANKATKGLVSQIGMFYAKCFLLIRGAKALWKAIESSMDYIETLNYFDAAWGQVAGNAAGEWKKAGYESAEAYAKSFSERAKALTGKMTGFQPDANGNLIATGMPSLGLDPEKLMNYQATFGQMASSMGVASETALKLSHALTMIGADLASVKNMKFEEVWQDMASGMVGMSRTLDKYGVNIRNVNLQEKLYELGIDAKIAKLGQQDKALLRTIILLQSTKYAWGDMANTIGQPANQLRLLQANFANLARTIGNLLLPIVSKVLPYINALVIAIQRLFSWIGGMLGIKIGGFSSSIGSAATDFGDMEDAADGIADSTGDAAKNTKKMADNLQGFDKLNVINSQKDSGSGGSGSGGGAGGLLDDAFADAFSEYQLAWDKAFKNMENAAQEMADRIVNAFQRIWDIAEPTRKAIERLWDQGLSKLASFTWGTLQDFWNNFLNPLGKWMLSDDSGLPRLFNITNDLLNEIDWERLRTSLGNFYTSLLDLSKFSWTSLMDFYEHFLKPLSVWTMSKAVPQLVDAFTRFNNEIDWKGLNKSLDNLWKALAPFAQKLGQGLVNFIEDFVRVSAPFINTFGKGFIDVLSVIIKWLTPFADELGYLVGLNMGLSALTGTFSLLSKGLKVIAKVITGSTLVKAFSALTTNIPKVIEGFQLLSGGAGTLQEVIALEFPKIGKRFDTLISLTTPFRTFASKVVESFSLIWGGAGTMREVLAYEFPKVAGFIANVVEGFGLLTSGAGTFKEVVALEFPGITSAFSSMFGALKAHPYLLIAAGIAAIAFQIMRVTDESAKNSAIGQFSQAISDLNEEVSQKTAKINSSLENTKSAIETAGVAEAQVARDLAKEYNELSDKASLSAGEKERLKQVSADLVEIIPNLSGYIDDETGYLDIQKESLDAVIQGYESLAQKQAAQEQLKKAYKDQYEAQMNSKHAEDELNNATDEYLKKAGLTKKALDDIKNGYLSVDKIKTGMGAATLNGEILNVEDYGFKANEVGAFVKAVGGLEKVYGEYNETLKEAQETEKRAGEGIKFINGIIDENTQKEKEAIEIERAKTLASADYQQVLRNLNTEFSSLNLTLSEDYIQNLALNQNFDIAPIQEFFKSLSEGVQASGDELKNVFKSLGLALPKELANAIAKMEPETQAEVTKMLLEIQSGAEVQMPEIKLLFEKIGYNLPDAIVKNFSEREVTVQKSTMDLLAGIQNGHSLAKENLIELFAVLGMEIPEALIEQLAAPDTNAEVQAKAIELLGQIAIAGESERGPLIEAYNNLGIGVINEGLISSLKSKEKDVNEAGVEVVKESASGAISESKRTGGGTFDEAGQNALDGYVKKLTSGGARRVLVDAGINMAQNVIEGIQKGQDSHSPSKETAKLAEDAVAGYEGKITSTKTMAGLLGAGMQMAQRMLEGLQNGQIFGVMQNSMTQLARSSMRGYNQGLTDEMVKTIPLIENWIDSMKSVLNGYSIALPGSDFTYTLGNDLLNQYAMAPQVSLPSLNAGSINMDYTAELSASLAGIIDYDKLGDAVYRAQSRAMQENPTVIGDSDIYNATCRGVAQRYNRTGKTGFKGID